MIWLRDVPTIVSIHTGAYLPGSSHSQDQLLEALKFLLAKHVKQMPVA